MTDSNKLTVPQKTTGDWAVDGVLAGVVAGMASGIVLVIVGLFGGDNPSIVLGRFDPGMSDNALVGSMLHLATSAVYGIGFGILCRLVSSLWPGVIRWRWLVGLFYGLCLLLIAEIVLLSGIETNLRDFSLVAFSLFHITYGLTLGLALDRAIAQS